MSKKVGLVITDMREMNNMAVKIADSFSSDLDKEKLAATIHITPVNSPSSEQKIADNNKDCSAIVTE